MQPVPQCCLCIIVAILQCCSSGSVFYVSSSDYSTTLFDAFEALLPGDDLKVKLYSGLHEVSATPLCFEVPVDPTLSANFLFLFSWISNVPEPLINLTEPDGASQILVVPQGQSNLANFRCSDNCSTGIYKICMSSEHGAFQVLLTVRAEPPTGVDPVKIDTALISVNGENSYHDFSVSGEESVVRLYAILRRGSDPVLNAKVRARYRNPSGNKQFEVWLHDDGLFADTLPRDGAYTGYITNVDETGKHAISILVYGDNETKIKTTRQIEPPPGRTLPPYLDTSVVVEVPLNYTFLRYQLVGYFDALATRTTDNLPPAKIRDAGHSSADGNIWSIRFTAVGDDYADGRATSYKILWSSSQPNLRNNVEVRKVTSDEIVQWEGINSPSEAGAEEELSIFFGNYTGLVYLTIQAVDDAGNVGEPHFPLVRRISDSKYVNIDGLRPITTTGGQTTNTRNSSSGTQSMTTGPTSPIPTTIAISTASATTLPTTTVISTSSTTTLPTTTVILTGSAITLAARTTVNQTTSTTSRSHSTRTNTRKTTQPQGSSGRVLFPSTTTSAVQSTMTESTLTSVITDPNATTTTPTTTRKQRASTTPSVKYATTKDPNDNGNKYQIMNTYLIVFLSVALIPVLALSIGCIVIRYRHSRQVSSLYK